MPTTERIAFGMPRQYMTDDMRLSPRRRPDVLTYQTDLLEEDLTFAGPIQAELYVSTSGTDADWIVKVIDVFPDTTCRRRPVPKKGKGVAVKEHGAAIRCSCAARSFAAVFATVSRSPSRSCRTSRRQISLTLQDVLHTFKKGHRVMVQVHSTWFPLVDRNPQKYVPNVYFANDDDFIVATQRVYRSGSVRAKFAWARCRPSRMRRTEGVSPPRGTRPLGNDAVPWRANALRLADFCRPFLYRGNLSCVTRRSS